MADRNSSRPIPERWTLVVKVQKDGSSLSYYSCKESGQKFYTCEDLMRYVNYAKAAKLSIYSPDFRPLGCHRKPMNDASISDLDQIVEMSDSEGSTSESPTITLPEVMEVASAALSEQNEACGSNRERIRNRRSKAAEDDGQVSAYRDNLGGWHNPQTNKWKNTQNKNFKPGCVKDGN